MNRREVLVGTLAASVATTIPLKEASSQTDVNIDPLVNNIRGTTSLSSSCESCAELERDQAVMLNKRLIQANPDVFVFHRSVVTPTFLYELDGHRWSEAVKSMAVKHSYSLERAQDLKAIMGMDFAKESLIKETVEKVGEELRQYKRDMDLEDRDIVWYVPIMPVRFVDLTTWAPSMGFKTRFATVPKKARIILA